MKAHSGCDPSQAENQILYWANPARAVGPRVTHRSPGCGFYRRLVLPTTRKGPSASRERPRRRLRWQQGNFFCSLHSRRIPRVLFGSAWSTFRHSIGLFNAPQKESFTATHPHFYETHFCSVRRHPGAWTVVLSEIDPATTAPSFQRNSNRSHAFRRFEHAPVSAPADGLSRLKEESMLFRPMSAEIAAPKLLNFFDRSQQFEIAEADFRISTGIADQFPARR